MDQSKALQKLTESADLVGMIEELIRTSQSDRLSSATLSGMRVTLRNIRESILSSHDLFAGEFVSRTRSRSDLGGGAGSISSEQSAAAMSTNGAGNEITNNGGNSGVGAALSDPSRLGIRRQSLRTSMERLTD